MKYICGCQQDPTETHGERERKRRQNGMNWKRSERLNKRPDGLSKIVVVRNVKRWGEGGLARQRERGPSSLPQKWEERKWGEKERDEKTVC